jgi:hypothetical protein
VPQPWAGHPRQPRRDRERLGLRADRISRGEEKAAYWAHLERSPSFMLMYVQIEGVQAVLSALPDFS